MIKNVLCDFGFPLILLDFFFNVHFFLFSLIKGILKECQKIKELTCYMHGDWCIKVRLPLTQTTC